MARFPRKGGGKSSRLPIRWMAHDSSQRRSSTNAAAGFFTSWLIGALSPSVVVHRRVLRLRIGERWYVSPLPRLSSAAAAAAVISSSMPSPSHVHHRLLAATTVASSSSLSRSVVLSAEVTALPTLNDHHVAARLRPPSPPVVFLFYVVSLPLNRRNQRRRDQSHIPSATVLASAIATLIIDDTSSVDSAVTAPSVAMALRQRRPIHASGLRDRSRALMFTPTIAM
jgi:hypothetical protein